MSNKSLIALADSDIENADIKTILRGLLEIRYLLEYETYYYCRNIVKNDRVYFLDIETRLIMRAEHLLSIT